jgi:hypothetical protein
MADVFAGALARGDGRRLFTTEAWTARGLVTYYTLFVIELHSRRVSIVGSTPHPDEAFVRQVVRQLTAADEGVLDGHCIVICDRDRKWNVAVRELLPRPRDRSAAPRTSAVPVSIHRPCRTAHDVATL